MGDNKLNPDYDMKQDLSGSWVDITCEDVNIKDTENKPITNSTVHAKSKESSQTIDDGNIDQLQHAFQQLITGIQAYLKSLFGNDKEEGEEITELDQKQNQPEDLTPPKISGWSRARLAAKKVQKGDDKNNSSWNTKVKPKFSVMMRLMTALRRHVTKKDNEHSDDESLDSEEEIFKKVNLKQFLSPRGRRLEYDSEEEGSNYEAEYVAPEDDSLNDSDSAGGYSDYSNESEGDVKDTLKELGQFGCEDVEVVNHNGYGYLSMAFEFKVLDKCVTVTVGNVTQRKINEAEGDSMKTDKNVTAQVLLSLVPATKFHKSYKTKRKPIKHLDFNEKFKFKMSYEEIYKNSLVVKLFETRKRLKPVTVAKASVNLGELNMDSDNAQMVKLENYRRKSKVPDMKELNKDDSEILIGLNYSPSSKVLLVSVIKGSNFEISASKRSVTFIEVIVLAFDGARLAKYKTRHVKTTLTPEYRELFVFDVKDSTQLDNITLLINSYVKTGFKTRLIGLASIGLANSTDEGLSHWNSMKSNPSQDITAWHKMFKAN